MIGERIDGRGWYRWELAQKIKGRGRGSGERRLLDSSRERATCRRCGRGEQNGVTCTITVISIDSHG